MVSMVLQRLTAKRVHFCMAGASIDISEEMIKSSILERFQIMMFLRYFFITTSSAFCFLYFYLFFFFGKVQFKIGVRVIHGRALYTGKYSIPSLPGVFHFQIFSVLLSNAQYCCQGLLNSIL